MIDRKTYEKEYMGKIVSDEEIINFLQNENRSLKKRNAEQKEQIEQLQQAYTITVDKSVIREQELEAQIEKMECCGNCINHNDLCYCELDRKEVNANNVCNKWEWEKDDTVSIFR